jgi:hypothetical protein
MAGYSTDLARDTRMQEDVFEELIEKYGVPYDGAIGIIKCDCGRRFYALFAMVAVEAIEDHQWR